MSPVIGPERSGSATTPHRNDGAGATNDWQPGGGMLIWLLLLVAPVTEAVATRHAAAWWSITLLALYAVVFALIVHQAEHGVSHRVRYPVLAVFVVGGLALTTAFNDTAVFVVVFTSMAVAISLPLVRPAFLGLLAVTAAAMLVGIPGGPFAIIGLGFGTYIAGFVTFVMRRLFVTIAELRDARQELATAAVAQERLRFARDLHDLLGHSLSVIVVKAELIRRTASRDPDAAAAAAGDIETVGRRALLEVRDAVSGYRRADLRTEIAIAEDALSDAGIATAVRVPGGAVESPADAILGWAVREGATNVLRHSAASRCAIEVSDGPDGVRMVIADDGTGADADGTGADTAGNRADSVGTETEPAGPPRSPDSPGNGLRGLSERVATAGGSVYAGPPRDSDASPFGRRGFLLSVSLPPAPGVESGTCSTGYADAR